MIGKIVSHFKIIEKLGEGGMGVVYKAEDIKLNSTVALKFLPPDLTRDEEAKIRFLHEAKAARTLDNSHICTIFEIDETDDGQMFIAMPYYEGETLKSKIEGSKLTSDDCIDFAFQIAEGLSTAHERQIIHRDIKPANIIVTNQRTVKIIDFGLARMAGIKVTRMGATLGTVAYMSPEQLRGEEVDHRTDIWSFGVVLYEMLAGTHPFCAESEQGMFFLILNEKPRPISSINKEVPSKLQEIVEKALQKNADERYQSIQDLVKDLQNFTGETEIPYSVKISIVVLPFTNMSAEKERDYLCDGIAEEIIHAIGQLGKIRVVARTSAFSFKDRTMDIKKIGQKLGVEYALEGSLQKSENRIRINVNLIKIADGYRLWSHRFEHEMKDIFAIQDKISLTVVENLKVKLLVDEKESIVKRHTDNADAYNVYLQGRYYWQTLSNFEKAIDFFKKAIQLDPNYSKAHLALAEVYIASSYWGNSPPHDSYPVAKNSVMQALELDNTLADAYRILGGIAMFYEWKWSDAEAALKHALELDPANAMSHLWYSFLLTITSHHDEAIYKAKKAQELDPLSSYINALMGQAYYFAGKIDQAIETAQEALEQGTSNILLFITLGNSYLAKSRVEDAISAYEKAVELSHRYPWAVANLASAYYEAGDRPKADELFEELDQASEKTYIQPSCFYLMHLARGNMDLAHQSLETAYKMRDSFLCWFRIGPLPDEPRFKAVMEKMDLEQDKISQTKAVSRKKATYRNRVFLIVYFVILMIILSFFWPVIKEVVSPKPSVINAVAVLPFKNYSGDPDHFSDGMTESLISNLGQVIRVPSFTTSLTYKKTSKTVSQIADELDVDAVVEGTIFQSGDQLRISANLIRTLPQEKHIWSSNYDRNTEDLMLVLTEVSIGIANEIRKNLRPEETRKLRKPQKIDPAAINAYYRGRFYWNMRIPDSLSRSADYFQKATEIDPNYALAFSGLADVYSLFGSVEYAVFSPGQIMPAAKLAAQGAFKLDSSRAETNTSLANITFFYDWDFEKAERLFLNALERNPNYSVAHHWYALFLMAMGRFDESMEHIQEAHQIDPKSPVINTDIGWILQNQRKYEQSIAILKDVLQQFDEFPTTHVVIGYSLLFNGQYVEAIKHLRRACDLSGNHTVALASLAYALSVVGDREASMNPLNDLLKYQKEGGYLPSIYLGLIYSGLGENKRALKYLESAFKERSNYMVYLSVDPRADGLRNEPRFISLLNNIGFENMQ